MFPQASGKGIHDSKVHWRVPLQVAYVPLLITFKVNFLPKINTDSCVQKK